MLFKRREPTEEQIIEKAEQLILDQLSSTCVCYDLDAFRVPAPAAEYAQKLVEERMSNADVKDKVDQFLECEMLDTIIADHIWTAVRDVLKEDIIKEIVQKINDVQIESK